VFARKATAEAAGKPWPDEKLPIELSRVYKKARQKPSVFSEFLNKDTHNLLLDRTIVFVEDKDFGDRLYDILIRKTYRYSQYFDIDKPEVLQRFANAELDCLVTCHKVSQGIDIQSLRNVVLFSSQRGKRETVQRLGRCLRRDQMNPEKVARVIDFHLVDDFGNVPADSPDLERTCWLTDLSQLRPKK
jgi:superfamily II DNA or RNA helicase